MKRRGVIAALVVIMVMASSVLSFADNDAFKMVSSYPKDGQKNTSIENVGVKVSFNHPISSKKALDNNKKCVKIVDQEGKEIPIKVLVSKDDDKLLLVLADNTDGELRFDNAADYKLVLDEKLMDDEGNTLGTEQTITFRTFNQRMNSMINMGMMFVMFGGIMVVTIRGQRQQNEEKEKIKKDPKETKKDAAFNPYRKAKETGKSVDEVMAEENKRREKEAKKIARKNKNKDPEPEYKLGNLSEILSYVHHVGRPRPISEAGGKYKSPKGVKEPEPAKKKNKTNAKRGTGKRIK